MTHDKAKLAAIAALSAGLAFSMPAYSQSASKDRAAASQGASSGDGSRSAPGGSSADTRSAAAGQSSPRDLEARNANGDDDGRNWGWLGLLGLVGLAGLFRRQHTDTRFDTTRSKKVS